MKHTLRHSTKTAAFCVVLTLLLSSAAHADVILTYLAVGTDPGNHSLDAQVTLDIDPASGLITAAVTNLASYSNGQNLVDDGQLIVDVSVAIDRNLSYAANSFIQSAPYGSVDLSQGVDPAATGSVTPSWNLAFNAGPTTIITLCDNPGGPGCSGQWVGGGGQHQQMIIGAGGGSNGLNYTNANSSLTNTNKNPDIYKSAIFQLSATGLPTNLTAANITSVNVYFGTGTSPQSVSGVPEGSVPEPGPAIIALAGLTLIGLTRKLRNYRR